VNWRIAHKSLICNGIELYNEFRTEAGRTNNDKELFRKFNDECPRVTKGGRMSRNFEPIAKIDDLWSQGPTTKFSAIHSK
jgi:hypothetical protein